MEQRDKSLEADFNPRVLLHRLDLQKMLLVKEEPPEEHSTDFDLQGPKPLIPTMSEDDDKSLLFSHLHQHQMKDREFPEDDWGAAESTRNEDHGDYSNLSEDDDDESHHGYELEHSPDSRLKTKDRGHDWKGMHSTRGSSVSVDKMKCFNSRKNLDSMRKVQVQRKLSCYSNSKTCNRNPTSNRLERKSQPEHKQLCCKLCGHTFSCKKTLDEHVRIHKGEKPFSCDVCGHSFSWNSDLRRHMKTHTGEKPFSCDVCLQRFTQKGHLNSHMKIHTGEKPFSCEFCGYRFSMKSDLNKHMKIHTGEKPFSCDLCGWICNRNSSLKRHMRTHIREKLFSCDV